MAYERAECICSRRSGDFPSIISIPRSNSFSIFQAVARVTELHNLFPRATAVLELIEPSDEKRLKDFECKSLAEWFPERVGRWRSAPHINVDECKSSFDYFTRRYGSFTWTLLNCWLEPDNVRTFNSNNVHGGSNCVVAIESNDTYGALTELAAEKKNPAIEKLVVFDG